MLERSQRPSFERCVAVETRGVSHGRGAPSLPHAPRGRVVFPSRGHGGPRIQDPGENASESSGGVDREPC